MRTFTEALRTLTLNVLTVLLAGFLAALLAALVLLAVLPTLAHAEACPNEAFRTGPSANLPDCRAYEMVSPLEKNGGYIISGTGISSPEGESVGFTSTSGFVGATSDIYAATGYQSSRGEAGWDTAAQTQSQAEFIDAHRVGATDYLDYSFGDCETIANTLSAGCGLEGPASNLDAGLESGRRLFLLRATASPEADLDFYLARSDGQNVEVGPAVPPTASSLSQGSKDNPLLEERAYIGLSADASHVVFTDPEPVGPNQWSFGGPGALLEYGGVGNKVPMLVGVDNEGSFVNGCATQYLGGSPPGVGFNGVNNPISTDGSKVFFTDACQGELFARVDNGAANAHTVAISEPSRIECAACDTEAPENAEFLGASEDGSKVFFYTNQPLLNESGGLFEYDFDAPEGEKITQVAPGFIRILRASNRPAHVLVSQDGSHVYFLSGKVLSKESSVDAQGKNVSGEPAGSGAVAQAGENNLYVFERDARYPAGHVAFVAVLSENESRFNLQVNATPDGRFLVLGVATDLTADDTTDAQQVFEYDSLTGLLKRVSVGEAGYDNDGNVPDGALIPETGERELGFGPSSYADHLAVSADGAYVFFESAAALTPHALNEVPVTSVEEGVDEFASNIYEYHDGQVYLISDGADISGHDGSSEVELLSTDLSGRDVFFTTSDPLVPQDTDTNKDIYDARIDSGFPTPAQPASCSGDACQGPLSGAPVLLSPGSEFQAGGDNLPAASTSPAVKPKAKVKAKAKPKKCKQGATLRHGKCVRQKAKKSTWRAK